MKRILNYLILPALLTFVIVSCNKDEVSSAASCSGSPSITSVVTPTDREKVIPGAKLDEWIIIKGSNLCNVSKIMMNDVSIDIKQAYVTANEITLQIPKTIPKVVNNKIVLTSTNGDTPVDFKVYLAPLIAYGYGGDTEDFTPIGQTMIIKCKNLDLYNFNLSNTTVSFGAVSAKPTKVTAEEITVVVPAGSKDNAKVTISNGSDTKDVQLNYRGTTGLIIDNDNPDLVSGWTGDKSSKTIVTPLSGGYRVAKGTYKGGWDWNESFHYANNQPLANFGISGGNAADYLVKFEINVPKDWTSNPFRMWYRSSSGVLHYSFPWGVSTGGDPNASGNAFKTAGWKTITIPLKDFRMSEDGGGAKKGDLAKLLPTKDMKEYIEYRLFVQGPDAKEMEFFWDNFRIVPVPNLN